MVKNKHKTKEEIRIFRLVFGVLLLMFGTVLLVKIITPLVLNLILIFTGLVEYFHLVDTNFKFIGLIFFFICLWKILEFLSLLCYKILKASFLLIQNNKKRVNGK